MEPFQYLEHTADVKFQAYGHTQEEMFENAALAMFNAMTDVSKVHNRNSWHLELDAENLEQLLYDWLSELLYFFEVELSLFCQFNVLMEKTEDGYQLVAEIGGEEIDKARHFFDTEVKAVTLHQFQIEKNDFWTAQVVLDV